MTRQKVIFVGASVYPETAYIVEDMNQHGAQLEVVGLLDDNADLIGSKVAGVSVLGPLSAATSYADHKFVFAIGSHRTHTIRPQLLVSLGIPEQDFVSLIHPSARVFPGASVGPGAIIHAGVIIGQEAVLERFNSVFPYTVIASRNNLSAHVLVTAHVSLTDRVTVGEGTFIGTRAMVSEGVSIGSFARVSMGTWVTRDLPDGAIVAGSPMRFLGSTLQQKS